MPVCTRSTIAAERRLAAAIHVRERSMVCDCCFQGGRMAGILRNLQPAGTQSTRFSTLSQRKKNREELNTLIGQWTAGYTAETIVRRLQKSGIAAGVVQNAEDLAGDSQLAARRFFICLQNPMLGKAIRTAPPCGHGMRNLNAGRRLLHWARMTTVFLLNCLAIQSWNFGHW